MKKIFFAAMCASVCLCGVSSAETYYIDANRGNDAHVGTSAEKAWRSIDKVNGATFSPGDRILFRAGTRYAGQLKLTHSGCAGHPIVVDRYGEGPLPRIDAEGRFGVTLSLENVEYVHVRNLELTNTGATREKRFGVMISAIDFGTAYDIVLDGLYVHDVNGPNVKGQGGAGIYWMNGGKKVRSRFDGLRIENCRVVRTDRNGICGDGYGDRAEWYPSLNIVIRGNVLEDIGGDGIVPIGTDGCLVERNIIRGARMRAKDAACGIWPFSSDNTLIQFNDVSGVKLNGGNDGQAYDSDYNCRNTIFQYNYSHDNEGGFFMACDWTSPKDKWSIGNVGTIVRYNISQNDGVPDGKSEGNPILFVGPVRDVQIYNNIIYATKRMDGRMMINTWVTELGPPDGVVFRNNIFYAEGETKMAFVVGGIRNLTMDTNVFFGKGVAAPAGKNAITSDPMFVDAGKGGSGLDSLSGYKLRDGSPCMGRGQWIERNGGRDFWGNILPVKRRPCIGASEQTIAR